MTLHDDLIAAIDTMTDGELDQVQQALRDARFNRAVEQGDPGTLAMDALQRGFSKSGDPSEPQDMGNGIVAMTCVVKDLSSVKHRCALYTIRPDPQSNEEYWVWDEEQHSYLYSETAKAGNVRRTVGLHVLPEGSMVIMHTMVWDGERHERKKVSAYEVVHDVDSDGVIVETQFHPVATAVTRRLPAPPDQAM